MSFAEVEQVEQKPSHANVELSLVVFNTHGPHSGCLVQRSGWIRDIDMFLDRLSAIPFSGGGINDAAVAEGLAEALMMLSSLNGSETQQTVEGKRHCVLIVASNPYPLPTPVYCPHSNNRLADAETVAEAFPQCSVSLSVICPRQLPKIRAIYNAGKHDPQAADPVIDTSNNPKFLVLISESLIKACAAFNRTRTTSLEPNQRVVEIDLSFVPPVSGPPATSGPSGNTPAATESAITGPAPPLTVSGMTQSLRPFGAANIRILNNVAQARQALVRGSALELQSMGQIPNLSSLPATPTVLSYPLMAPGNSNASMSHRLSNIQGSVIAGSQRAPVMNRVNPPQSLMMHQNMLSGMPSGSGTMMMPTPGMTQPRMPLSQLHASPTLPSAQSNHIQVWEGDLSSQRQGQTVIITRLKAYRTASASKSLAANWPPRMQIVRLITQEQTSDLKHVGKAVVLVFHAMDEQHRFLSHLQEKKLSAVVQLPSQTLILSVFDNTCPLIGMLYPRGMVVFKTPVPNQEQPTQHARLQQLQQSDPQVQQQQELDS